MTHHKTRARIFTVALLVMMLSFILGMVVTALSWYIVDFVLAIIYAVIAVYLYVTSRRERK